MCQCGCDLLRRRGRRRSTQFDARRTAVSVESVARSEERMRLASREEIAQGQLAAAAALAVAFLRDGRLAARDEDALELRGGEEVRRFLDVAFDLIREHGRFESPLARDPRGSRRERVVVGDEMHFAAAGYGRTRC